jgi:hypothetical protein
MIPDIPLASNPETIISLREATVKDVIDFTDIDKGHEEQASTMFLNRMQPDRATWSDSKLWTAEDRRTVLFWHWLHTAKSTSLPLSYQCAFCGKEHTFLQDMRVLGDGYRTLKEKPERELKGGMIVRPLTGADMEFLERGNLSLSLTAEEHGKDSGVCRKQDAQVRLLRLLLCLHTKNEPTELHKRVDKIEDIVLAMPIADFTDLVSQATDALSEMSHGIETTMDAYGFVSLVIPPHYCTDQAGKEKKTLLRVPFRNLDYIPQL